MVRGGGSLMTRSRFVAGGHKIFKRYLSGESASGTVRGPLKGVCYMSYAIFKTGGKQYRVSQGDVIDVEKLDHSEGDRVVFSDVLMLAEGASIKVGQELENVTVEAEVDRQYKGEKVLAYKYRRRKGYHRTVGHRRRLTRLKITGIKG